MTSKGTTDTIIMTILLLILIAVALALYGSALWQFLNNQVIKALLK